MTVTMDDFTRFLGQCRADLKRIAGTTRQEHRYEDVCQQAWPEARGLADGNGGAPDYLDPASQQAVLRRLYIKLVHGDRQFRHATRLDHGSDDDDAHPLMRQPADNDGHDPLSDLLEAECTTEPPDEDRLPLSLALAWALLLRRHDQHMHAVAARLLISVSHAYHCGAKARWLAAHQCPMPLEPAPRNVMPQLGPWRRQRAIRTPQQLAFDFDDALHLADAPCRAGVRRDPPRSTLARHYPACG